MEKILITGANGFIGSHLTDFCLKKGYKVYAFDIPNRPLRNLLHYTNGKLNFSENDKLEFLGEPIKIPTTNKNLIFFECNLKNSQLLEKILYTIKPKFVFHFGAQPFVIQSWKDPVNTIETNVIGTINIFEPIKKHNIKTRVIVACTSAEYGTTTELGRPLRETDPLLAIHPYGISKVATELLSRQYFLNFGIEIVNLRFFNQTGPRKKGDACADFISKTAKIDLGLSEPIIEVGNLAPYRDFTDIKDSIQAIFLSAIKGKSGETYNVCSSRKIRISEILSKTLKLSNKKIKVIENSLGKLRATDEDIILGDNSKLVGDLGWKITRSIDETLGDMFGYWIEYHKNHPQ